MTATTFAPTDTLQGRVAVIAGGTGAIGLATARRLAALGAHCVLLYRSGTAEAAKAHAMRCPAAPPLRDAADGRRRQRAA